MTNKEKLQELDAKAWEVQISGDMGGNWHKAGPTTYANKQDAVDVAYIWASLVDPNNYRIYRVVQAEPEVCNG